MRSARLRGKAAVLVLLLAVLGLSGCAGTLFTSPPPNTYALLGPADVPVKRGASTAQILVPAPTALKILDSQSVVVMRGALVAYYPDAQYTDTLPRVVQARIIDAFERSHEAHAVGRPGEGLAIDYQIITEIRKFDIRLDGNDRAEVELFVRVLNDRNGTVRAAKEFTAQAAVSGSGNAAYASALDAAFRAASVEIVDWSVSRF